MLLAYRLELKKIINQKINSNSIKNSICSFITFLTLSILLVGCGTNNHPTYVYQNLAIESCESQIKNDLYSPNYISFRTISIDEVIEGVLYKIDLEVVAGEDKNNNMKLKFYCKTNKSFKRWDAKATRLN